MPQQKKELLSKVREKYKDDVSFDVTNMYSMLEVMTHAQETTVMEVEQFFEAIEDPLLQMLVPIVTQIAVEALKPTMIGGLCMALPPVRLFYVLDLGVPSVKTLPFLPFYPSFLPPSLTFRLNSFDTHNR